MANPNILSKACISAVPIPLQKRHEWFDLQPEHDQQGDDCKPARSFGKSIVPVYTPVSTSELKKLKIKSSDVQTYHDKNSVILNPVTLIALKQD